MAKVISVGEFEYLHKACKSRISFKLNELEEDYSIDYLGDKDYYRILSCPGCGKVVKFPQYGDPC